MAPRSQPHRVTWPLTPYIVGAIDEMFQILFDDIRNGALFPFTTRGDMLYFDGEDNARLPIGAANTVIRTSGDIPEWGKVDLTDGGDTTGTLPVDSGGTGATSFTAYAVILGGTTATSPLQDVGDVGTLGQILTSQGAAAKPIWSDAADVISGTGYWSPLTNGDPDVPELIFDGNGDTIAVFTET